MQADDEISTFSFSFLYFSFMLFYKLLFLFRIYPFSVLLLQDQNMKFFTKRLNKKKLTKSHTETKLVTPVAHQHDNNKPLPPSPSSTSLPPSALTANLATKDVETINNDSWLELNLPNDFSSSLDIPQLQPHQSKEVPSNKLEINTEKSLSPEAEKITEVSSFSYPNNFINTTTHNEVNKPESTETVVTALESSNILMPSVDVDKESQREKR